MKQINIDPNLYEQIQADYIDENALTLPPYSMYRLSQKGQRHYIKHDGLSYQIAPSVTTILHKTMPTSPFLIDWKVRLGEERAYWMMEQSANYGTALHHIFGRILLGSEFELHEEELFYEATSVIDNDVAELKKWYNFEKRDIRKDLFGFVKWVNDYNVRPIAIEYPIFTDYFAGTADLIAKIDLPKQKDVVALIDYKTGTKDFYESHAIQLAAYRQGWNQDDDLPVVEKIFNYGCHNFRLPLGKRVTPYRFKDQTDTPHLAEKWNNYLTLYLFDNVFDPKVSDFDEKFTISKDADLDNAIRDFDLTEPFKEEE